VLGVTNTSSLATVFQCTSLDTSGFRIAVEVFSSSGALLNDVTAGDGALTLSAGQTGLIATGSILSQPIDDAMSLSAPMEGAARIISTSSKVACAAFVTSVGSTPSYHDGLRVLKGKAQKGD